MPFQAEDVDLDADFDELIKCQWAAFEKPYQGFFHLICPIHGTDTNARDEAIKESTERQLLWSKGDPTGHWQKAVTDNDDKIVGGALWKVYGENPHAEPPPDIPIYWYPEGPQRDFAAASLGRLHIPLVQMSARPHIFLNIMFTHPEYRLQGVADELMKWGLQKADELRVEMWLNASPGAVSLYKKHGFVMILENDLNPSEDQPSEEWNEMKTRLRLDPAFVMWRPPGGIYVEGRTVKSWEAKE